MHPAGPITWKGTDDEKQILLRIARRALDLAVEGREFLPELPDDANLQQPAGVFVTLHSRGRLRGCIGRLGTDEPLVQVVAECAKAAALEDPRFDPVRQDEIAGMEIEISVLSGLEEVTPNRIEIGRHGLVVGKGFQRGVLLPQVAAGRGWTAERFLEETCLKAGLEPHAWKDTGTLIQIFTAEVFSESNFESNRRGMAGAQSPLPLRRL
jgi:uncharacterized protein